METHFIREVSARYDITGKTRFAVSRASDVVEFIRNQAIRDNTKEHFIILSLDAAHQVATYSIISIGTANYSVVHPREVFQAAILSGAVAIIISHNHPSGEVKPSPADHEVTKKLKEAGELLNIKVLDHIIVSDHDYYSFQEHGAGIYL